MGVLKFISQLLLLTFIFSSKSYVQCVEIGSDGGYNVRIAIDSSIGATAVPDTAAYIKNIKDALVNFNNQLHASSKRRFFIKNAELLIPSGWNTTETKEYISDSRNYGNADIKVSRSQSVPYVERAQVCGAVGKYLELPSNFFNQNGAYGKPEKALTALWAQLRYGVFEENGYENDARFPYFYRKTETADWEPTGCANKAIAGVYRTTAGQPCDPKSTTPLDPSCRFIPATDDSNSGVTSSLMHFHWLNSVTEFCDDSTHNPLSPNRHNAMCKSRSVWNVIESSDDYKKVTAPVVATPAMNFKVVEQPPLFYFLMDRGKLDEAAQRTIIQVLPKLGSLFSVSDPLNWGLPPYTVAAIGAYPNDEVTEVEDLVPWTTIRNNEDKFFEAFNFNVNGNETRRFTIALNEVIAKIKAKNHAAGAVILHLRTGGTPHTFAHLNREEELLSELRKHRISLNTIELNTTNSDGNYNNINLVNLAKASGGTYAVVQLDKDIDLTIDNTLGGLIPFVEMYSTDTEINDDFIYNELITKGPAPIPIVTNAGMRNLKISFTTTVELESIQLGPNTNFVKRNEWMAVDSEVGKRNVYSLILSNVQNEQLPFQFNCAPADELDCSGYLSVYGTYSENNFHANDLNVKVYTSALNNKVDFNVNKEPLSIFAQVRSGGVDIAGLTTTLATITHSTGGDPIFAIMSDDGKFPDVKALDGIYSTMCSATKNGSVTISVEVKNQVSNGDQTDASVNGRLLPVDQIFPPVRILDRPTRTYQVELDSPIEISNVEKFKPYPEAINSLKLSAKGGLSVTVDFIWPNIIGNREAQADSYVLKKAESVTQLINNFDNSATVLQGNSNGTPGASFELDFMVEQGKMVYYAMKTTYQNTQSDISNIVGVQLGEIPTTTVNPTTTGNSKSSKVTGISILALIFITFFNCVV